jgi:hypothetical protein
MTGEGTFVADPIDLSLFHGVVSTHWVDNCLCRRSMMVTRVLGNFLMEFANTGTSLSHQIVVSSVTLRDGTGGKCIVTA